MAIVETHVVRITVVASDIDEDDDMAVELAGPTDREFASILRLIASRVDTGDTAGEDHTDDFRFKFDWEYDIYEGDRKVTP